MKTMLALLAALVALAPPARADEAAKKPHGKQTATFIRAEEIQWGQAPPDLPQGGQIAVLQGDPTKSAPFVIRLKAPDGYRIAPHWHSQDEQLTVIAGTLMLHMGDSMESPAHALVGMVTFVGQWWTEARKPDIEDVANHLVALAWMGLRHLPNRPVLKTRP